MSQNPDGTGAREDELHVSRFTFHDSAFSLQPSALPPGRYRHFKGGEYEVLGLARHSETEEEYVIYRPLKEGAGLWIRPLVMFTELVERDGTKQPRFQYLGPRLETIQD